MNIKQGIGYFKDVKVVIFHELENQVGEELTISWGGPAGEGWISIPATHSAISNLELQIPVCQTKEQIETYKVRVEIQDYGLSQAAWVWMGANHKLRIAYLDDEGFFQAQTYKEKPSKTLQIALQTDEAHIGSCKRPWIVGEVEEGVETLSLFRPPSVAHGNTSQDASSQFS